VAVTESPSFRETFRRRARSVRRWLVVRYALGGLAIGALAGGALAAFLWWRREGELRPWGFAAAVAAGLAGGLAWAWRRRWSDQALALYLDARLESAEAVTTALEGGDSALHKSVERRATETLEHAPAKKVRPRWLLRWHALVPSGGAAGVWLCLIPLPPAPLAPARPAGVEIVKKGDLPGLDRIEALAGLGGENPEQSERLKRIAAEAKKVREALEKGIEKREALARLGSLRDDIAAERQRFGDAKNRAGLDAATSELEKNKLTAKAGRALGDGDLTEFDAEMQRLASLAEKEDRDAAREALERAAKAAREKGAHGLGDALERQQKALERAEAKSEALRELAKRLEGALDEEGRQALGELGQSGNPEAQKKLAEALDRALKKLSEEERRRLAENLKRDLQRGTGPGSPTSREELEELARRLGEKGADQMLEEQLRELARRDPSDDARRESGLGEADRGGADAQRGLGAMPVPMDGAGKQGRPGQGPKQESATSPQTGNGEGRGGTRDEGSGDHRGGTQPLDLKELRSKADPKLLPGMPMHSATLGRAPARPGETANQLGTGKLGSAAPAEIGAVEGADIPEEYREQVGRYFEP
jgi:hypothetical protein